MATEVRRWKSLRKRKAHQLVIPPNFYYTGFGRSKLGFKFSVAIQVIDKGWYESYFDADNFKEIEEFLFEKIKKDRGFLNRTLRESNEIAFQFLEFCRNYLNEENLKKESDKKLMEHLHTFERFYEDYAGLNVSPWVFLSDRLFEELKGRANEGDVILLSTVTELSYMSKFEVALLKLILNVKQRNLNLDSFEVFLSEIKKQTFLESEFNALLKKYFWMPFEYVGPEIYDEKQIFGMIKENKLSVEELDLKIKELVEAPYLMAEKQRELAKKLNLDEETCYLFECMRLVEMFQDVKKECTTEEHFYFQLLVKELARRMNVDYLGFYVFLPEEIESLLNSDVGNRAERFIKEFEQRKKCISVADMIEKRSYVLVGEQADNFMKENKLFWPNEEKIEKKDSIVGSIAALGYVVGKARVLSSSREMSKVQDGDIIFASMTTPDYVPAMKKASAIITDEGGITCHASIVSRELGIPCIIGTVNATKSFSDDDLIEVDARAGKGTIRKLSFEEFSRLSLGKS